MIPEVPAYLEEVYWWAYMRPSAVRLLDRPWLINLYLYGWYHTLKDETLKKFGHSLPFLGWLEPTASDLWKKELKDVLPREVAGRVWEKTPYFGGLYQMLVSRN